MDLIADRLGIDPLELRLQNLLRDGDEFATGQTVEDFHLGELVQTVSERIGWTGPGPTETSAPGLVRGKGIACTLKTTVTPSTSTAAIKLNEDGSASLLTSTVEIGQGARTVLAQIAADAAGNPGRPCRRLVSGHRCDAVGPDDELEPLDADDGRGGRGGRARPAPRAARAGRSPAVGAARGADRGGRPGLAGQRARPCPRLRRDRAPFRSPQPRPERGQPEPRGARPGDRPGRGRRRTSSTPPRAPRWRSTSRPASCACVDLHVETYAGKVVNPVLASLQCEGNVAFGVGQALFEEIELDGGQIVNPTLADYMIPSLRDLPEAVDGGARGGSRRRPRPRARARPGRRRCRRRSATPSSTRPACA